MTLSLQTLATSFQHRIFIDSRRVIPNSVFIAIKGEQFDGHDFITEAIKAGAVVIVSEKPFDTTAATVVIVPDTRIALGKIAHYYRETFSIPVIGITGSCGKTSTKALAASVLSQQGKTLATEGTLNNDLGVPLTLFRLDAKDQFAVIEMGANHPGEIALLAQIASPSIAAITNAGPVHLEGFGSVEGVQKAKGELYDTLPPQGTAIVNIDDAGATYWLTRVRHKKIITVSTTKTADIYASNIQLDAALQASFTLHIHTNTITVHLPMIGLHQVPNALIAAAIGFSQGISLEKIKAGLETAGLVQQRGILKKGYNGALILDDSYNANPKAFAAAIDMLMATPARQHVVVMGDMGELGEDKHYWHSEIGRLAAKAGVDIFYTVGALSAAATESFAGKAQHFEDQTSLILALKEIAAPEVCFLVKGSKSSHMGNVVTALLRNTI